MQGAASLLIFRFAFWRRRPFSGATSCPSAPAASPWAYRGVPGCRMSPFSGGAGAPASPVFQAFPNFILAVAVAGMLGTGLKNSVLALGAVYWITYAKLSRSLVLSIRDSEYIRAAKICGAGPTAIIFKYILPNMVSPLIVTAALDVSSFILSMAGLSFLGLGPSRPTAEWGATMSEAKTFIQQAPWCIVFPGLALLVTVVIFNLLGDALRDVIDEG